MLEIKNLKHLKELDININHIDIKVIEHLPEVQDLKLYGSNSEFMKVFSDQDNSHINYLTMDTVPGRTTLEKISTSMPHLKSIELYCKSDSIEINNIMKIFNRVEKLQIHNEYETVMRNRI